MESIVVACITGVVTLVGVILSNSKSRAIMAQQRLVARAARKRRRHSSYEGEITEAPENLLLDERGKHHFRADEPNELWITDVTEFRVFSQA